MQRKLTRSVVRDAVVVAVVAVVVFQALRRWGGDRYLVPSGSMEPVLHGDPEHGDVVFVCKGASAAARRRHDLVVVQHPQDPRQQLVKRIAARGDDALCWVDIRLGDLWLGEDDTRLRREQKDPVAARAMRVTWADAGTAAGDPALVLPQRTGDIWRSEPAVASVDAARRTVAADTRNARRRDAAAPPAGFVGTRRPVDAGYVDANGARGRAGNDVSVRDVGMAIRCLAPAGNLLAAIDGRNETLAFHWQPASGRVVLWRDGEDVASKVLPGVAANGAPTTVEFGLLDDRVFFCIGEAEDACFVVPRLAAWDPDREVAGRAPRTLVWIGALGDADGPPLVFDAMRVFHDVHVEKEAIVGALGQPGSWPRFVEPGHWFLLGDCAFDSRDSRHFGSVSAQAFVGVPLGVLGPWPRTRWVRS